MSDEVTYDEAEEAVREYVVEHEDTRTYVSTKDICRAQGIEENEHNRTRVHHALSQLLTKSEEWSGRVNKYEIQ